MSDTGFAVKPGDLRRFGPSYTTADTGGLAVYDEAEGQWSRQPAFPSGGGGLVSTVEDFLAFAEMLASGGRAPGGRILSRPSVEAMTTDHLTPEQRAASAPVPIGAVGWGFGVGVQARRIGPTRSIGAYGWDGGLGTSWANDPVEGLTGILLTNRMWTSPSLPAVCRDFWTCAYAAVDD